MFASKLMKNPLLMIGLLFLIIFLFGLSKKGYFSQYKKNLTPTSCRAVRVKLDRRIPANWNTSCEGNNLAVVIKHISNPKNKNLSFRKVIYREIANNLIYIAKNSPSDNLERTTIIRLRYIHPKMTVNAVSEGKFVVKLATLKSKKMLIDHIKTTVQIQETPK